MKEFGFAIVYLHFTFYDFKKSYFADIIFYQLLNF